MKKSIFFSLTLLLIFYCQSVNAQINNMRQQSPVLKAGGARLPNPNNEQKTVRNNVQQVIPAKGNIHPLKLVKNFSLIQNNKPKNLFALHTTNITFTKSQHNLTGTSQLSSAQMAYKLLTPSVTKIPLTLGG